jgi:hypothetical protein
MFALQLFHNAQRSLLVGLQKFSCLHLTVLYFATDLYKFAPGNDIGLEGVHIRNK